ncbi:MAG: ATP-binding cassette domain-containing protein [Alphaproteobacteria bacterium]|nr:ATP-binding cassette domain-containing protein [Alphaproteobacteria bacterium]
MTVRPIVAIDRVSVAYGDLVVVHEVSLDIAAGETVGLVGESGSGKTSLGKAITMLKDTIDGTIAFEGEDVRALVASDRLAFRRRVQMIFQDPVSSLSPRLKIRSLLAEPIEVHGLPFEATWRQIEALMADVGLSAQHLDKYPHELSGGQARRVALLRSLVLAPRFIVCDEPTAGLDVSVQGDLLNLLCDLQITRGLTYLIISHNLNVIRRVTDTVAVMYLGQIVEVGETATLFARPAHPYTASLIAAIPTIDPDRRRSPIVLAGEIPSPRKPPTGCRFHPRCPSAQARCRTEAPARRDAGPGRSVACHFPVA